MHDYQEKLEFVKKHRIALWDSIKSCYREGSLDGNIMDEEPNDIEGVISRHPTIRLIACNGTKSYKIFRKNFNIQGIDVIKMPSTSPIPGRYTKSFEGKVEAWSRILDYLV
ncbi:DNA-deoxyinosine glycosylase [Virgibacillus kekensis]|uniref:DNA-deoxyinosine glycosylase n=1 Tax=Virgibacillus kekensis TaxID=202261 RepID=A0ABV9DJS1_9BACI